MKIKTADLSDAALDLAVSRANNPHGRDGWGWFERDAKGYLFDPLNECRYSPSTDWAQGGPIIEREKLVIAYEYGPGRWQSYTQGEGGIFHGPTPLAAAMRCFVASKLGDEVEIPDELIKDAL